MSKRAIFLSIIVLLFLMYYFSTHTFEQNVVRKKIWTPYYPGIRYQRDPGNPDKDLLLTKDNCCFFLRESRGILYLETFDSKHQINIDEKYIDKFQKKVRFYNTETGEYLLPSGDIS